MGAANSNRTLRKRCLAGLGLIVLLIAVGVCIFPARKGVDLQEVRLSVNDCFATNGYTLSVEAKNDVPYAQPPLSLRIWTFVTQSVSSSRLGGVGHKGVHGQMFTYVSGERREIRVAVDMVGKKVFAVTVFGDEASSNISQHLEACFRKFGDRIQFKLVNLSGLGVGKSE